MDPELYDWLKQRIGPGKQFGGWTHALERGVWFLQKEEERRERDFREARP